MSSAVPVRVPALGDFKDIPVIEILVKPGDRVSKEQSLVTLESDKATLEIPSPASGVVAELKVTLGDKVSEGSVILLLEATPETSAPPSPLAETAAPAIPSAPVTSVAAPAPRAADAPKPPADADLHAEVLVLGAGPGGYSAAFRAADLGKRVVLVERDSVLGGVCLNVGCIPSKALLHAARVITEAEEMEVHGIRFGKPVVDLDKLRAWKQSVVARLTQGLTALAKQRKVQVVQGAGRFTSPRTLAVATAEGDKTISFDACIIAAGSRPAPMPGFPNNDPRLMDSTAALELADIPGNLLVVGGGIIGLEMATVYDALGSRVTVVEWQDQLIPGADADLVKPLARRIAKRYEAIHLKTKVAGIETASDGLQVSFEGDGAPGAQRYDRVLVAVGRRPNGTEIGAEFAGVAVNERRFIPVDQQMRTNVPHIFAIGDIADEPMLAHKASHQGKLAAEVIAGHKAAFDARAIPSVAYTDPEIAWVGATETQLKAGGADYERAVFPWAASGRALASARDEGCTKLLFDRRTRRLLGAGIVGLHAGELIAETALALEMGADAQDMALTIHPHPSLSETVGLAAEIADGTITDLYFPKK